MMSQKVTVYRRVFGLFYYFWVKMKKNESTVFSGDFQSKNVKSQLFCEFNGVFPGKSLIFFVISI